MTTGETGIFRVARDLYLMISWIADAKGITQSQMADRYLRHQIIKTFILLRSEIHQRKLVEDEKVKKEGTKPVPLPRIKVHLPLPLRKHEFHSELDHEGPSWEWADQMSEERLVEVLNYQGAFEDRDEMDDYVGFEAVVDDPVVTESTSTSAGPSSTEPPSAKKKPKPKK